MYKPSLARAPFVPKDKPPGPAPEKLSPIPDVIPESTASPKLTPLEHYRAQAEKALANEEKVAAEHRARWDLEGK